MNSRTRRAVTLPLALVALSLGGCYAVEDTPDWAVIRFNVASRLIMILIPVGGLATGAALGYFRRTRIAGAIVLCGTVLLGGLVLPGMYLDTVAITPTEITQKTGFWFAPTVKGFRYADVRSVSIREVPEGASTMRVWTLRLKDGATRELDVGDLWEFNEAFVVQKLRGYGVTFEP